MRVVFFGTPAFAVPSLAALLATDQTVVAVVTQPDRPRGRSHSTLSPPPVKEHALAAGIPVWQPERPRGEPFLEQLRALHADLGVVVAYGHLLPPELLAIPSLGLVNVHASLLPRWRGAAPIQWAILAGDRQTGVAIMRIEAGLDTGPVWHTAVTDITASDTAATLTDRLAHLGAAALVTALPSIAAGVSPEPQADRGITHAAKVDRALARLDWSAPSAEVSARIRAMDPAPGAWTTLADDGTSAPIKVWATPGLITPAPWDGESPPGTLLISGNQVQVASADAWVTLTDVQPAGKRRMAAAEWLRGAALPDGARLA
ncbi:MAG TPA: methionyl-tRNA formyltransferase [Gemmatimonadales bacterium]|jgi:methionyl-tRNA formyltransferase